ncbi:flagellar assembly protein FliW [Virgibacillus dakarensis]|uniref:Flagellar assembly factor FliW n=1 Tax=Lentibacillus populi TaxID=1827502 RepID=A0A9W5U0Z8_9BACI|nr:MULTISPECIES: flagellar assembly protein FliW [Bacillaceae]MBT2216102.1 flagellar assembly protein FliW [Virgibacillus dakarensis]MTW86382.1 flagellar assembly protein FliW [Virgibacillus dakarensis]GGB55336.1 flagellar assembly factor FliW [Lentibacillus populi]
MKIQTKYLGELEIDDAKRIQFPAGLPGFGEDKEFVLLDFPENPVFQLLQSVMTQSVAFVVTTPYNFYQGYTFDLDDSILESLQIENERDVAVFSIVTLSNPFEQSTLNLKAPVILNWKNRQGKQYILNTDEYESKAPIAPSAVTNGKGE